ncbi:MAG: CoA transferase, partial [Deltaproteobacteria bacterium]|nr:CoA transferase [Deltaproteobacteria bacterium]
MEILKGIRVIDLTQFIAGSRCTQILADMGADVVKVEPPEGDTLRLIFKLLPGAERKYSVYNRNKFGMAVDWKNPKGQDIVRKLAAGADVFVNNLIPGTLEKYRLGYDDINRANGNIIYLSISGFGSTGTNPERAAFDIIAQATSGQFWNDMDNLRPPSNYWGDMMSGAYGAIAILLALIHRMNSSKGQFIDLSMQDVGYFNNYRALVNKAMEPVMDEIVRTLGRKPDDVLNSSDRMPFYGFFKSKNGKVAIVAITRRQWQDLAQIVECPALLSDPGFSNLIAQIHNHERAVALIEAWTSRHTSEEIVTLLEGKKIPCGIAYDADGVNNDDNLRMRGMYATVAHETLGTINVPGIPYKFSGTPGRMERAAPGLGEDNRHILG